MVLFNNRWYLGDNSTRDFIHFDSFEEDPKTFVFDYRFIHNKVLSGFFGVIWTKFYKKSFLEDNNIGFPSHKLYNDLEFHIKSVLLAKRIAYCPKIFYHYNKLGHPSLQTKYVGKREAIVFYDVMVGIRDFLIEKGFMDEFRIDFLNFTFRHLYSKINEMEDGYKNEFFLKIKEFFESILITADEFNQMSFRNLPIYIHIVNSNSYEEFNNFYIMRLEDIICEKDDEINKLESNIENLKKTTDEYFRIKENYTLLQKQNKELVKENSELKKGVSYKIKKYF